MPIVEMLSTGDEVLHGQIIDTNAAWLADCFFQEGFPLNGRTTTGDNLDDLVKTLCERSQHADILIVNGGLGPTSDDLSALAAATAAGVPLVEHVEWIAVMERYFASRERVMPETNRKQALLPEGAELIDNPVGTACGFAMELNGCWLFFTPGVPSEFKVMVDGQILPRLRQRYPLSEPPLCLRLTTFGRSESSLATQFDPLSLPESCVLGYRSSMPIIELKLTGPATQKQLMLSQWQTIKSEVNENLIFEGTEGLPNVICHDLNQQQLRVAISEEFSAGLLTWTLNSVSAPLNGSSVLNQQEDQSLAALIIRASTMAKQEDAQIGLAIGDYHDGCLNLALYTPQQSYAQRVRYMPSNHSTKIKQDVSVMLMLDMLLRWLRGRNVFGQYEWLEQSETLVL
ncbi:nicotinamide mononucleotide deamidase-related protein YfaY [Providencia manganoxydans]|uniref:nicotinamide mononucleotide deamidase-related protein YfaY n=1 Tax=Providencia manganoxydans TaxID=2923283 RepID=UPI003AF3A970